MLAQGIGAKCKLQCAVLVQWCVSSVVRSYLFVASYLRGLDHLVEGIGAKCKL